MLYDIVNIIVVYPNRTDTMRLYSVLQRMGVKCLIVPTPNQISASCGLSLKSKYSNISNVLYVIQKEKFSNNFHIFGEKIQFGRSVFVRLK